MDDMTCCSGDRKSASARTVHERRSECASTRSRGSCNNRTHLQAAPHGAMKHAACCMPHAVVAVVLCANADAHFASTCKRRASCAARVHERIENADWGMAPAGLTCTAERPRVSAASFSSACNYLSSCLHLSLARCTYAPSQVSAVNCHICVHGLADLRYRACQFQDSLKRSL